MRCPGQDMRYWTEDAVFDVPCPKCGSAVEFFKDETSGRCAQCGLKFKNPKKDLSCAEWCAYAEECLGFVPQRKSASETGEGALASRLIQAVKEEFKGKQDHITHALVAFRHAKELTCKEGANPRVVFAATLLLDLGGQQSPGSQTSPTDGAVRLKRILEEVGLDEDTIRQVCEIVAGYCTGKEVDSAEFRVVSDSDTLAGLASQDLDSDPDKLENAVNNRLKTAAGKERVRSLFPG